MCEYENINRDIDEKSPRYNPDFDIQELCEEKCVEENGGYYPYPGDCCSFVVCNRLPSSKGPGKGRVVSNAMRCSVPLVWNTETSSCDFPYRVPECNPACHDDVTQLPINASTPFLIFNESAQCFFDGHYYTVNDFQPECFFLDRREDTQVCCLEGQIFNVSDCCCEWENEPTPLKCDCLIYSWGIAGDLVREYRGVYINTTGVTTRRITDSPDALQSASANFFCFDGEDAVMKIPRFENYNYLDTFSVHFLFQIPDEFENPDTGFVDAPKMGLLTNGCCNKSGTFEMYIEGSQGFLNIITEKEALLEYAFDIEVESLVAGQIMDISISYCAGRLNLVFNGILKETGNPRVLGGRIKSTGCPLTLGSFNDIPGTNFKGCINNLIICQDCWTEFNMILLSFFDVQQAVCNLEG
ncbi:unnamed protein product [Owenia fusiformis]|uniref:Uncharacterized protein n=1 Tax=Owenia fusiformis TaxID=6347 RepID=A0A8J1TUY6_OWEFU|nr:unnamed protein product [Owenia fusiformis]